MTFEEAVKKAIKSYRDMEDDGELETNKLAKDRVYDKKYFDNLEEEILPSQIKTKKDK